jgi:hypothetical protein
LKGFAGICADKVCCFEAPPLPRTKAAAVSTFSAKPYFLAVVSWLLALGGAAALALAGVFALATLIPGLAAALALTGVLSLASVGAFLPHCLEGNSGWGRFAGREGADSHRSGHETGHRGTRDECFRCIHVVLLFLLLRSSILVAACYFEAPKMV